MKMRCDQCGHEGDIQLNLAPVVMNHVLDIIGETFERDFERAMQQVDDVNGRQAVMTKENVLRWLHGLRTVMTQ